MCSKVADHPIYSIPAAALMLNLMQVAKGGTSIESQNQFEQIVQDFRTQFTNTDSTASNQTFIPELPPIP